MSRSTLKLPAKPAAAKTGEFRRTTVRPVEGRRASAPRRPLEPVADAPRARPKPPVAAPKAPGPEVVREAVAAEPVTKVYPKRGVARSTGARALPPVRPPREAVAPATPEPMPQPVSPKPVPAKGLKLPNDDIRPRLARQISLKCGCSRREADDWIENGWVSVDGVVVNTLGIRVDREARIEISDDAGKHQNETVTVLYHKPAGEADDLPLIKTLQAGNRWADDSVRKTFKPTHRRGLQSANRIADGVAGMQVLTREDSVIRRLTRDENRLEKEYIVEVDGTIADKGLELLRRGLSLDDVKLKAAQVSWQNERQLRFVLRENLPQQIERMCVLVGLRAAKIRLIRIGSVSLGKLPAGQWRYLRENERF